MTPRQLFIPRSLPARPTAFVMDADMNIPVPVFGDYATYPREMIRQLYGAEAPGMGATIASMAVGAAIVTLLSAWAFRAHNPSGRAWTPALILGGGSLAVGAATMAIGRMRRTARNGLPPEDLEGLEAP